MPLLDKSSALGKIPAFNLETYALFFQRGGESLNLGCTPSVIKDVIANRLLLQHQKQSLKLIQRISQNMYEELEKHKEAHRVLENQRFKKEFSIFHKTIAKPV